MIGNPTEILGKYHKHHLGKLTDKGFQKINNKKLSSARFLYMTLNLAGKQLRTVQTGGGGGDRLENNG